MNATAADNYRKRMARVLDHIDRHPDGDLRLEALAGVAAFSKFHFHRQFGANFGISVQRYVNLSRMKRAAFALACRPELPVIEIALAAGFQSPDSFAKAFRGEFGVSPSAFRKAPDWAAWQTAITPYDNARKHIMASNFQPGDVEIVDFAETPIIVLSHRGDPAIVQPSIARFIDWRKANRVGPQVARTFNMFYGGRDVAPEDFRIDLACEAVRGLEPGEGMERSAIAGGRCARLKLTGVNDELEVPATWLYRDWLPQSGETLRDFPLFCERSNFGPGMPESEMVTELYLPLE
ncbi:AraC family transcriptional regulator [Qipengyuania soli]|uniref:AraC family transcriptional regulator n=1 Tax=Qipengyuania soli TaxID=2782568 RepID=A0A7S8IVW7_9SPHN|nr:GyrI-like domain-containing protein [Qipengyuania soli]QPC99316.1 AraC family transcriptional regulator [Qipengyuania soli]